MFNSHAITGGGRQTTLKLSSPRIITYEHSNDNTTLGLRENCQPMIYTHLLHISIGLILIMETVEDRERKEEKIK